VDALQSCIISKEETHFHSTEKKKGAVPTLIYFNRVEIGAVPFGHPEKKERDSPSKI
jgi:hypothetical protein